MRIPVGQREVAHMVAMQPIVRDLSEISHRDWILQIEGLVQNPLKLTYEDLLLLPKSEPTYDIHCVTSWTKLDQQFSGVDFRLILEMVQPLAEAKHVIFESVADAYSTNVVLAELQAYPSLLAYEIEGAPIELRYG